MQQRSGLVIPVSLQQEGEGLVFRVPDLLVPMLSEIRTHRLSSGQVAGRPEGACTSVLVRGGLAAHCCCFRLDAARVVWSSSEQRVRQKCRVAASTLVSSVAGRCSMGVRTVINQKWTRSCHIRKVRLMREVSLIRRYGRDPAI